MEQLTACIRALAELEVTNPGLVSRPLLRYLTGWLDGSTEELTGLADTLRDGLDVDFTGTQWETEWLSDDKVCQCKACRLARECLSKINRII